MKREHLKSLDNLEAQRAAQHLVKLEEKLKIKKDQGNMNIVETANKAK